MFRCYAFPGLEEKPRDIVNQQKFAPHYAAIIVQYSHQSSKTVTWRGLNWFHALLSYQNQRPATNFKASHIQNDYVWYTMSALPLYYYIIHIYIKTNFNFICSRNHENRGWALNKIDHFQKGSSFGPYSCCPSDFQPCKIIMSVEALTESY